MSDLMIVFSWMRYCVSHPYNILLICITGDKTNVMMCFLAFVTLGFLGRKAKISFRS